MGRRYTWMVLLVAAGWLVCGPVLAKERRFALLVVNQRGWAQDPPLRYAVKGDLQPLSRQLRRLGFVVKELINQTPQALRKAMKKLAKIHRKKSGSATFLFYYSGHADRTRLHMGPNKKRPFTYQEFLKYFQNIRSQRRFAIFDACFSGEVIRLFGSLSKYKKLLREGRLKGVRKPTKINISRLQFPHQGQERGLRIITSSLQLSWELNRYRASVFTYHFLRGLRGAADLDGDGKISVDELFDFTSREVKRVTGQKPQQLVVARRGRPYALAPAYHSRLRIDAGVKGRLQVSVGHFLWLYKKPSGQALTLSLVHGKGQVRLRRGRGCWRQSVLLPKGGEVRLGKRWRKVPCRREALRQKGSLSLPAVLARPERYDTARSLALSAGFALQGAGSLQRAQPALALSLQWRWFQADLGFSHGFSGGSSFSLSRVFLQAAAGAPLAWSWPVGQLRLFAGGFVRGGLVLQHQEQDNALTLHGVAGGLLQVSWWFSRWGIRLETGLGVDLTPSARGLNVSPFWQLSSAIAWAF